MMYSPEPFQNMGRTPSVTDTHWSLSYYLVNGIYHWQGRTGPRILIAKVHLHSFVDIGQIERCFDFGGVPGDTEDLANSITYI